MINWRAGLSDIFDFESIPDDEVKLKCDSKQYPECLSGLKEIYKTNKSAVIYENLIVASLKLNDDEELRNWVTEYLKDSKASERSMIFAQYLGMTDKIPTGKNIQLTETDSFGYGAKALEHWRNKEYKEAIDTLLDSLKENSASAYPYYALAQIYYERGYPELARTVATNGYENTESKALLPLMYQLNAVTFSTTSASSSEVRSDLSPAESFALAFTFIKNKDSKSLEEIYQLVKTKKHWFKAIKTLELVYTDSKNYRLNAKNKDFYLEWLQTLFKLSKGQEEFVLDKISSVAQKNQAVPNYSEIERMISNREVAGERK
jgi:lipopolysaccharide biosynthesis regulator YciM